MAKEVLEMEVKSNIGEVAKDTEKLTTASGKAQKGVGGIGKAFKGMGTAIKAAGIGLVVGLLAKLMEVFSKNQKVLDVFNTAMTALSIAFNDLFGFISNNIGTVTGYFKALFEDPGTKIKEMGTAIKEGLIARFNEFVEVLGLAGKALGELVTGKFAAAFDTIKEAGKQVVDVYTGVDDSFEKVTETIKGYVKETIKQADAITQTAKAAGRAEVEFARLNAKYLKDAEIQRQIRDDETKTFAERIEANKNLSKVLDEQAKDQAKQVVIKIANAQAQYDINDSEENYLELGRAKNEMLELEETITGQLSEQKTNQVGLEKELLETQNQLRADGLSGLELELQELKDAYELKLELAEKAGVDTTEITKRYTEEEKKIKENAAQEIEDFKKGLRDQALSALGSHIDASMSELEGSYSKEKRLAEANGQSTEDIDKRFEAKRVALANKQKAFKVAEALITTYQMAALAYKDGLEAGGPAGLVLGPVAAAVAAAAGLANVRSIMAQDVGGGGGGGGGVGPNPTPPAPQMMSGAFDISGGVAPEATKAFVVTDEMTNSQNQLANIRRRATI